MISDLPVQTGLPGRHSPFELEQPGGEIREKFRGKVVGSAGCAGGSCTVGLTRIARTNRGSLLLNLEDLVTLTESGAGWRILLTMIPALAGILLGNRFRRKISQQTFERMVLGLLGLVGVSLMAKNLIPLF